jgi:hypothetical protein
MNELLLSFLFHIFDVDSIPSQIFKTRFVSDWCLLPQAQVYLTIRHKGLFCIWYGWKATSLTVLLDEKFRFTVWLLLQLFLLCLLTSWLFKPFIIMGSSQHGAKFSFSIKRRKLFDKLRNYSLLKDTVPWSFYLFIYLIIFPVRCTAVFPSLLVQVFYYFYFHTF